MLLKKAASKAFADLGVDDSRFYDVELLLSLVEALTPIEKTVLKLSKDSIDLMKTDGALMYLLRKLDSM